jgi:hypothetical protein
MREKGIWRKSQGFIGSAGKPHFVITPAPKVAFSKSLSTDTLSTKDE